MADHSRDHLLEGLYALVQRAVDESAEAEDPVPHTGLARARRTHPPELPDPQRFPGLARPAHAANAISPPGSVRFRGR